MGKSKYAILGILLIAVFTGLGAFITYEDPRTEAFDLTERVGAYGHFTLSVYDEFGNLKAYAESDNTVVDVGIDCIGDLVFGTSLGAGCTTFDYLHIGNGTTGPTSADTTLDVPKDGSCARIQDPTVAGNSATPGEITVTIEVTFDGSDCSDPAIGEAAVFDALTSGNMMARALISPTVAVTTLDTLTVTYNIVIEMV